MNQYRDNRGGIARDVVEIDGKRFIRYPESCRRHLRCYFVSKVNGKKVSLHRYLWSKHNGSIPAGYEIHHKDENPLNNDIDNLECLTHGEHMIGRHREMLIENGRKSIAFAQAAVTHEWKRTEEGRRGFSERMKAIWQKRVPVPHTCIHCGSEYETIGTRTKYCTPRCKELHREPR